MVSAKSAAVLARTAVIVLNWSRNVAARIGIVNAVVLPAAAAWRTLRTIESVFGRFQSMFDHPGRTELRYTSKHRLLGTKGSLSGAIP